MSDDAVEVARFLSDRSRAVSGAAFPVDQEEMSHPGLYSWWVDDVGKAVLEESIGYELPDLIYAGQAGATSSRSGKKSTATLGSRIGSNHLNGTAYGSTFRKSISGLLLEPLRLRIEKPDRLEKEDKKRVSEWMKQRLGVVVYPFDNRDTLGHLEDEVLQILDPPLNLMGVTSTPVRRRLTELRRRIAKPEWHS